ncbi:hypothetical protein Csa_011860 [Cucumis sativus]|nr:hypothetical protein Csa_011860 [Cucumis sativus]
MANLVFFISLVLLPHISLATSSCDGPCQTLDDCEGQLICINGVCNDDPNIGTNQCSDGGSSPSPNSDCQQIGSLNCDGESFPQYQCSPPVTSSTQAILTNNDFSEGGDGGAESKCGKMIRITATNGNSVLAKVVDECDSVNGCDAEHANQPPCRNNIVDGSDAVWSMLE